MSSDSYNASDSLNATPNLSEWKKREEGRLKKLQIAADKIREEEWEVVSHPKATKSEVWQHFLVVRDQVSKNCKDFAQCQKCGEMKAYTIGCSTTSLKRHYEACVKVTSSSSSKETVSPQIMAELKDVLIAFCVGDLRSFKLVEGANFFKLIQKCIDIGAEHGQIKAENVLPSATTIRRGLKKKADEARELIKPQLRKAVNQDCLSVTTDMWVESYN